MRIAFLMMVATLTSCAHSPDQKEKQAQRRDRQTLEKMERRRESGQFETALKDARAFLASRTASSYRDAARLEEGRALEGLKRFEEAEAVYKDIREKNAGSRNGFAGLAEFRLSFIAEATGDDLKALSHVLSAERRRDELPKTVGLVEVPARKAVLYYRMNRDDEGRKALQDAERGLSSVLSNPDPKLSERWLDRLYLDMGRSAPSTIDAENFSSALRAQRVSQAYLLKALRSEDPRVFPEAFELLRSAYARMWSTVVNTRSELPDDSGGLRSSRQKQIPMLAELLRLIEEALQSRPIGSANNDSEEKFFAMADVLSAKAREILYANSETTVLTEESAFLNGIRRERPGRKTRDPNL